MGRILKSLSKVIFVVMNSFVRLVCDYERNCEELLLFFGFGFLIFEWSFDKICY